MGETQDISTRKHGLHLTFNAPVTLTFVALCAMATWASLYMGAQSYFVTYRSSLTDPLMYVRLLTHVLGHASWEHFMSNMLYILLLGPLLEEKHGSGELAAVIIVTALATGIVNNVVFPNQALCGASGVCFALILLSSITGISEGEIPITFVLVAVVFLGQQMLEGVFTIDNVSQISHVIGGIVGAISGFGLAAAKR